MAIRQIRTKEDDILYKKCKTVMKFDEKLLSRYFKPFSVSVLRLNRNLIGALNLAPYIWNAQATLAAGL